jgi:hypothetical protein
MRIILLAGLAAACLFQAQGAPSISSNTRIYIDAGSGLNAYLPVALEKKHVPARITTDKASADYAVESSGRLVDLKSGNVLLARPADAKSDRRALQNSADACAKRLAAVLTLRPEKRKSLKTAAKDLQIWPSKDPALNF